MKLRQGHIPPGGWHFEVTPTTKLTAATKEILTNRIFEYRIRNNLPSGDIEREIDAYYCSRWPEACCKEAHEYGQQKQPTIHSESMLNRVARWASAILRTMGATVPLVSPQEAFSRGRICSLCPKNVPWRGGCGGCSRSAITVLAQIRRLNQTPIDGQLMGCVVGGWENTTAIWFNLGQLALTEEQLAALPEKCWRKGMA